METIKCKVCKNEKSTTDYYGKDKTCKVCRKEKVIKYRKENLEKVRAYDRERGRLSHRKQKCIENTRKRRKDPDGYMAAHNAVARALKSGRLERMPCVMCGETKLVHAHHDDYSKPLDVMWLCVVHHKARHAYLEYIEQDIF
jgi:hypothetical protein